MKFATSAAAAVSLWAAPAMAAPSVDTIIFGDSGDTAWVLTATALVLLLAVPGLMLWHAARVPGDRRFSVPMHGFTIAALISLLWIAIGYSLAFSEGTGLIGGTLNIWLNAMGTVREDTTIPETAFALFQMMPALMAPLLIAGAVAERVRFGWLALFSGLWSLIVFVPVTHWLWGGGWLAQLGAVDFAGGMVIHLAAGVSALVVAIMVQRRGDGVAPGDQEATPMLALAGGGLMWVGWLGLSGGSALGGSDDAASAMLATHVAACAGALTWALADRLRRTPVTAIGLVSGALAGFAAVAAAAGYISMGAALLTGVLGSLASRAALNAIARRRLVDDSAGIFAIHGVSGLLGALLCAVMMSPDLFGGTGYAEGIGAADQLVAQAIAVGVIALWSAIATLIIGYALSMVLPMRTASAAAPETPPA